MPFSASTANRPTLTKQYPAAINRFLDYAVIHTERSLNIHLSGFFLTWHRFYVQLWYNDLCHTCGYKGPMPYWNWPATAGNLQGSAVFDGSDTSMSGDGVFNDTGPIQLTPSFSIPHGSGGGCVYQGPFAGLTVTLNTIPASVAQTGGPLPADTFANNPVCLQRDLNSYVAQTYTNFGNISDALNAPDIEGFSAVVDGNITASQPGIHAGAHFQVGGQMANLFVSPQDPIWYLTHSYLDLLYTQWQDTHPEEANGIFGTQTFGNVPPSDPVTPETFEPDWGYFYPSVQVKDLLSTKSGPFCYRYE